MRPDRHSKPTSRRILATSPDRQPRPHGARPRNALARSRENCVDGGVGAEHSPLMTRKEYGEWLERETELSPYTCGIRRGPNGELIFPEIVIVASPETERAFAVVARALPLVPPKAGE